MRAFRSTIGSSLIEVVTTMGILGVLYAAAVPVVSTLRQNASLVSAQREVMSTLYRSRTGAIASNSPRRVVFTPPATVRVTDSSGTTTYYTGNLDTYGSGVRIATELPITVIYDARGLLNPPTTVRVTVRDPASESKTVIIYPTGKPVAN
jgi:Tfp pilus assembly protein FimT